MDWLVYGEGRQPPCCGTCIFRIVYLPYRILPLSHQIYISNVPGVAMYFTGLTQLRAIMATSPYFSVIQTIDRTTHGSTLPKLSSQGNLLAGAATRVAVGFILNPVTVLKARYEVRP